MDQVIIDERLIGLWGLAELLRLHAVAHWCKRVLSPEAAGHLLLSEVDFAAEISNQRPTSASVLLRLHVWLRLIITESRRLLLSVWSIEVIGVIHVDVVDDGLSWLLRKQTLRLSAETRHRLTTNRHVHYVR